LAHRPVTFVPEQYAVTSRSRLRRLIATEPAKKTFDHQSVVPRLPIPDLQHTANLYLRSCQPLLSATDYAQTETVVKEFIKPGGVGVELQRRLVEYDQTQKVCLLSAPRLTPEFMVGRFMVQKSLFGMAVSFAFKVV
jgi:hypothetical protein